jgi:DNA-binding HxlR family transcriptional regulator
MAKPGQFDCGLGPALKVIAGKWRPTIIWTLHAGPIRFGVLRRRIGGISEKILFEELRALEEAGIVHRETFEERAARVEYSLTPAGAELNGAVHALAEWGSRHFAATAAQAACLQGPWAQDEKLAVALPT